MQNFAKVGGYLKHQRSFPRFRKEKSKVAMMMKNVAGNFFHLLDKDAKQNTMDDSSCVHFEELLANIRCRHRAARSWVLKRMYQINNIVWLAVYLGDHGTRLKKEILKKQPNPLSVLLDTWQVASKFGLSR